MICLACKTNYESLQNQWIYVKHGMYKVMCDVFTSESLRQILQHALNNQLTSIYVDTFNADHTSCEGCTLLHIRLRTKRMEILNEDKFLNIEYQEFF